MHLRNVAWTSYADNGKLELTFWHLAKYLLGPVLAASISSSAQSLRGASSHRAAATYQLLSLHTAQQAPAARFCQGTDFIWMACSGLLFLGSWGGLEMPQKQNTE